MQQFEQFWKSNLTQQWITPQMGCAFFVEKQYSNNTKVLSINLIDIDEPFQNQGMFSSYLYQLLDSFGAKQSITIQVQHVLNPSLVKFLSKIPNITVLFDPVLDVAPTFQIEPEQAQCALYFLQNKIFQKQNASGDGSMFGATEASSRSTNMKTLILNS